MSSARTVAAADHDRFVRELRAARKEADLPLHARVVAWGMPGSGSELDLSHVPEVGPLLEAGFEIDAIVSPAQAMARLVNARKIDTSQTAVAAVALNTHGVATAIVSRGEAISARTFEWPLGRPFTGGRDELLERYLVVSQVAPQLQHVIDLVRPVYGVNVSSILVCGNLPNLRSLAMLLIDEMDIEIETLDSVDLLASGDIVPSEAVPSLQLAAAVSLPAHVRDVQPEPVAAAADDKAGWGALRRTSMVLTLAIAGAWAALQLGGLSPAAPLFPDGLVLAAAPAPVPAAADLRPEATIGRMADRAPAPVPESAPTPLATTPVGTTRPVAPRSVATPPPDPLPRVDGIMISDLRRMAIIDGTAVAPGDKVGARTVVRIERDGVVLREPSGRAVHVAIRMRK